MIEDSSTAGLAQRYFRQTREMYGDTVYTDQSFLADFPKTNESLDEFEQEINQCMRCALGETRIKFVFGVGDPHSDIVFVGEAPGREEDRQGEPFVGRAGKLLDKILAAIHMNRNQVYICNVLKCRPPDNRTPSADEIATCMPYLEQQLSIIDPKLIVALGATAAHSLLSVRASLAQLRSKLWKWNGYDMVITYHPAALLRNPNYKRPAWEDFQWIQRMLQD
ncbi:MAG: uracil-DNA glycosylase [Candidatus Marinimicrobia bacterium]|jgi:DNA polymerase|nr:uracil-DNA glycosylase [Candidatus Neomarinimicrobiota bacterium]MDP6836168.1 uracil-DNA glycosylase [Candidatus Neomarinimicrobiota bacterium]|tara:strand:- start:15454 stop:16119 length:666 start_codon:yes stop_codon:yes gene_type:complete